MSREWKPGDVALVRRHSVSPAAIAMRGAGVDVTDGVWWGVRGWFPDKDVLDARPLVVIDPDDAEQIGRLATAYDEATHAALTDHPSTLSELRMHAALRSLIAPPKPEEPTGLGAVVEDSHGDCWVWMSRGAEGPHWHRVGVPSARSHWSDIDAVRVLRQGVNQ